MLRKFVDYLKEGKTQTDAARLAGYKLPNKTAVRLIRNPLVVDAMDQYRQAQQKAEERVAEKHAEKRAVTKAAVMDRLWELAQLEPYATKGTVTGQVRAAAVLAEILGMKIGAQNPDKFEGFTDVELEQYAKDGTVPERFAIRFGITPGGPSTVM